MVESNTQAARWVFMSYPRRDRPFVRRVSRDLERAGLRTWVDAEDLQPGTDNWQRALRRAVSGAHAVILVCTPNTAESPYVQAELLLAQQASCMVLPIWADGEHWIDCIPLGLVNYQYIDFRGESYQLGLTALVDRLRKEIAANLPTLLAVQTPEACPNGYVLIIMSGVGCEVLSLKRAADIVDLQLMSGQPLSGDVQLLGVNPAGYQSMEDLLQSIYARFLRDRVDPFTYGRDWLLAKPSAFCSLLALPWEWLEHESMPALSTQLSYTTPLADHGFGVALSGTPVWAIVTGKNLGQVVGVLASHAALPAEIATPGSGKWLSILMKQGRHTLLVS